MASTALMRAAACWLLCCVLLGAGVEHAAAPKVVTPRYTVSGSTVKGANGQPLLVASSRRERAAAARGGNGDGDRPRRVPAEATPPPPPLGPLPPQLPPPPPPRPSPPALNAQVRKERLQELAARGRGPPFMGSVEVRPDGNVDLFRRHTDLLRQQRPAAHTTGGTAGEPERSGRADRGPDGVQLAEDCHSGSIGDIVEELQLQRYADQLQAASITTAAKLAGLSDTTLQESLKSEPALRPGGGRQGGEGDEGGVRALYVRGNEQRMGVRGGLISPPPPPPPPAVGIGARRRVRLWREGFGRPCDVATSQLPDDAGARRKLALLKTMEIGPLPPSTHTHTHTCTTTITFFFTAGASTLAGHSADALYQMFANPQSGVIGRDEFDGLLAAIGFDPLLGPQGVVVA